MNLQYILDEQGNPVTEPDLIKWSQWMETLEHRVVKKTTIGDSEVSTVFLGLDHNFSGSRKEPVLFETMVFGGKMDGEQWRYATKQEAINGHNRAVDRVMQSQVKGK